MTRTRTPRRTGLVAGLLALTVIGGLAQLPASGSTAPAAAVDLDALTTLGDPVDALGDRDLRGTATPLADQRGAVAALGASTVRWNDLGTPASILPADGSLGAAPGDAVAGARAWLREHAAAFGLTPPRSTGWSWSTTSASPAATPAPSSSASSTTASRPPPAAW